MKKYKPLITTKNKISIFIDVVIVFIVILIPFIFFSGGFTFKLYKFELTGTTLLKPSILLLVFFVLKLFCADYSLNSEKNKILLFSTLFFVFITGELVLRTYNYFFEEKDLFWVNEHLTKNKVSGMTLINFDNLKLHDLIKLNGNKAITYEFIPNLKGRSLGLFDEIPGGYEIEINSQGFRDNRDFPKEREKDTQFRIIGFGDSEMFGLGIDFDDTYGEVIERDLNARIENGKTVDFLNMAVPGYNTTMNVETFFEKGINFNPDLVLLAFHNDNLGLPSFIIKKDSPLSLRRSFFLFYISKYLNLLSNYNSSIDYLENFRTETYQQNLIPEDYLFMFGKQPFIRELKRLKQKCDELEVPLIMFINTFPRDIYTTVSSNPMVSGSLDFAIQTAKEMEIPAIEWRQEAKKFLKKKDQKTSFLEVSDQDPHSNKTGHFIKGKALASFIYRYLNR